MKLTLSVNGHDVVLTSEQAEAIMDILSECDYIESNYKKKPDSSEYHYEYTLSRTDKDTFKMTALPEARYNELKFFTAAKTAG